MTERAKFVHPGTVPPIGYVYAFDHEGTTFTFQAPTRLGIKDKLRAWYRAKDLEWPGDNEMYARVEDFVCKRVPPGFCKGGDGTRAGTYLSGGAIRDVTRLILNRTFKGEANTLVTLDEAERRAKICANCPLNLHGICTSCAGNEFQEIMTWFIRRSRTTKYDQYLDTCSACGCLLKAKVHVTLDELARMEKHTYPENCWLHGTKCHKPAEPAKEPV